jgi:cytochrome P450
MPFGAGPRVCLGEPLALNRLFLAMVVLCQRFRFRPDPNSTTPCDPRTYEFGGILKPLSFNIILEKWEEVDRK